MNAQLAPRGARFVAWLVVGLAVLLMVLGLAWYGFSLNVHHRIWRDIAERPGGPMSFRFLLQPAMAAIAAFHDGIKDARTGRSPYFWTVLHDRAERGGRLREGLLATARIALVGIGMDAVYQGRVLDAFYPGETVIVAFLFAVLPYFLLRGPIARVVRRQVPQDAR